MAADLSLLLFDPDDVDRPDAYGDYNGRIQRYLEKINKQTTSSFTKLYDGQSVLNYLDPTRNTISYAYALNALIEQANKTRKVSDELVIQAASFLENFDPVQARYVGGLWRDILVWFAQVCASSGTPAQAIPAVRTAILRMDPTSSTFTSNHLYFLHLCLQAQSPRQALPILDHDISSLPTNPLKNIDEVHPSSARSSAAYITPSSHISAPLHPHQIQEYHLLGAHIYLGLRNYARARLFLELVLSSPTPGAATPLMVEAYKRHILVSLLTNGKPYPVPSTVSASTLRAISPLVRAYDALAETFRNRDLARFRAEAEAGREEWEEDGNAGVVKQVEEGLRRVRVRDLQRTFAALRVGQMARLLAMEEAETVGLVKAMIKEGSLDAVISEGSGGDGSGEALNGDGAAVVRFSSAKPKSAVQSGPADQAAALEEQAQRIQTLSAAVREADRKLALSREYVDWRRRTQKQSAGAEAENMDTSLDVPGAFADEDEDMMGDL